MIDRVSVPSKEEEMRKLKRDFDKLYSQYNRKYSGKDLVAKLFIGLKRKGYKDSQISKIIQGAEYEIY